MSAVIKSETLAGIEGPPREVLAGEIAGLKCLYHTLAAGELYDACAETGLSRIVFFLSGRGTVTSGEASFAVSEISAFAPGHQRAFSIRSSGVLTFLELIMETGPEDLAWAAGREARTPWFESYSTCRTYRESIKSEKTVSRTLIPEDVLPRFCAGSVQTSGPDIVAAHRHGMLEQLFLGVPENDCVVQADEAFCRFNGNMLLHIPLGSEHSVRVAEGKPLHYIWIDLFRSASDMSWITQNHFENKP